MNKWPPGLGRLRRFFDTQLEVERITLEVDDLRAHFSVLAVLANLVIHSVGADVQLSRVKLEIEGVLRFASQQEK
jgi:hypothetical protein